MKRSCLVLAALAFAACGPAEIVVTAELRPDEEGAEAAPVSDLEVWILPYDRDVIFDSLTEAAANPEPPIPEDLRLTQQQVAEAQQQWRDLEQRWNTLRDTLQTINRQLQQFNRGEARYVTLFRDFQSLENQYDQVERRMQQAFQRFDSLSKSTIGQSQQLRIQRQNWADEAFADVGDVIRLRLQATGMKEHADTTDASGIVRVEVKPGEYWVHARFEGPYNELYWNVPVTAERGEPVQVQLTRENAEQRLKL